MENNNKNIPANEGAKKPLNSNLITIIIAAVAVVVLIALLVPTLITLNNKNADIENFNTQLEDLKGQIATLESADKVSAADVETAIKTAIAGIDLSKAGLSEEAVTALIGTAIAGVETGLNETEVKAVVDAAVAGLELGLKEADVKTVVDTAIAALDLGLNETEVKAVVDAAIAGLEIGLNETEVKAIVDAAVAGLELGLDEEAVQALIDTAIAGIDAGLDETEVKALITSILLENGLLKPNAEDLTLAENIAIANDVTLAADTTLSEAVSLAAGEYMALDLNGKTLVLDEYALIDISGRISIKNGNIIVKSAAGLGLVVSEVGELILKDVKVTLAETGAYAITNYGEAKITGCTFEIDDTTADINCAIYNAGMMRVKNISVKEVGTSDVVYAHGAPIYNTDLLVMISADVASSGFCTSTLGGTITVDANSTLTLTGDKQLTPDGDYFAYNAHNGDEPTANNCYEFVYFGKAEENKINLEFKEVFANGGNVTLTEDAVVGSAFTVEDGKTVVIDLGGKTLTLNENAYFALANGNLTVKNGTVIAKTDSEDTLYCFTVSKGSALTLDDVTFKNESCEDGINNAGTLVVNDSTLTTAAGCGGVSGSIIYNYSGKIGDVDAIATITNSTIDNTAAISADYFNITPIINYGTMTLDNTVVNSNTSCIFQGSYLTKTTIIDGAMNHGTGDKCAVVFAEWAAFLDWATADVTWTVNGEEVDVSVIYMK